MAAFKWLGLTLCAVAGARRTSVETQVVLQTENSPDNNLLAPFPAEYCSDQNMKGVMVKTKPKPGDKVCVPGSQCCVTFTTIRHGTEIKFKANGCELDTIMLHGENQVKIIDSIDEKDHFTTGTIDLKSSIDGDLETLAHMSFCMPSGRRSAPVEEEGPMGPTRYLTTLTFPNIECARLTRKELSDFNNFLFNSIRPFYNKEVANATIPRIEECNFFPRSFCKVNQSQLDFPYVGSHSMLSTSISAQIVNSGFEDPAVTPGGFQRFFTGIAGWTAFSLPGPASSVILVTNGNPVWGGLSSNQGAQFLALQASGSRIEQIITVISGVTYEITFLCSRRPNNPDASARVIVRNPNTNAILGEWAENPGRGFTRFSFLFTSDISGQVILEASNFSPFGDLTVFFDNFDIQISFANPSFDDQQIPGDFEYQAVGSTALQWEITGAAVVALSGNLPWNGVVAPTGSSNYLVLQGVGSRIEQTLRDLATQTTFIISFFAARRPPNLDATGRVEIRDESTQAIVAGVDVIPGAEFSSFSLLFTPSSLTNTIIIRNTSPPGDNSVYFDDFKIGRPVTTSSPTLQPTAESVLTADVLWNSQEQSSNFAEGANNNGEIGGQSTSSTNSEPIPSSFPPS
ncbi:hypothetical protein AAMO2058_001404600 [Amorphochlora amoebiformis]